MIRRVLGILGVLAAWAGWAAAGLTCPFCSEERGPTLVGDFTQASMVLVGTFSNPVPGPGGTGTTDFTIESVLKSNDIIKDKKVFSIPKFIPDLKNKVVLYCDVYKGDIDPYRAVEVQKGSDLVKYLTGAMALKEKTPNERLRYCFDFLNSAEFEVAIDAYREFAKADYSDYKDMAKKLPPDTIAAWLKDPKTPPYRLGLYASLLGHCGKPEHAKLLRGLIDDAEIRKNSGIDGIMAAYLMLQPKEAWTYLTTLLKNTDEEFMMRYAGLRTLRFLWDQRSDLVDKKDIVKGMSLLISQPDMSDFAIDDLRKWKQWDATDRILDLWGQKTHEIPIIRKAILRFALQSPQDRAKTFVNEQRKRDSDWVKDTEELLKLES